MKKIRITENELVSLIEKLVKENLGDGIGQIFPLMGAPSEKYKDLLEKDDVEETDEVEEDYEQEDHKDRDEFDGRKSRVVGVDSDIKKQRMGESKKKSLKLTESQLINIIEKVIKERKK